MMQRRLLRLRRLFSLMRERNWLILILLVAGVATQFLWLSYPREVVFDEVHFGKFVTAYCCTGERFFDIHPPHAKLLVAGVVKLFGYGGELSFTNIGQPYGTAPVWAFRLVPAVMGVLLPLVLFGLWQQLGASPAVAFFGALLVVFDNALTVQNRVVSLDGLLLVATFGALSTYLWMEHRRHWWRGSLLTGTLCGLAVGAKFTGLAAIGLIGVMLCWRMLRATSYRVLGRYLGMSVLIVMSGLVVYGAGWALHFALLPLPGPGDAWRVPQWEGNLLVDFWRETREIHKIMYEANYNLTATHPDASPWWSWPMMKTSIFYWQYGGGDGRAGAIYFLGNPLVWWGIGILFVTALVDMLWQDICFVRSRLGGRILAWRRVLSTGVNFFRGDIIIVPLLGYFISFVPLMRVPRSLFLYHYLTPLLFAWLMGVMWLDRRGFFKPGSVLKQPKYYFVLLGAVVALFVVFSPLTYGFLLPPTLYDKLFWLTTWR